MKNLTTALDTASAYLTTEQIKEALIEYSNLRHSGADKAKELGITNEVAKELRQQITLIPVVSGRWNHLSEKQPELHAFLKVRIEEKLLEADNIHSRSELEEKYIGWYLNYLISGTDTQDVGRESLAKKLKKEVIKEVDDIDELINILDI